MTKMSILAIGLSLVLGACASPRDTRIVEGGAIGGVIAGPVGMVVGGVVADGTRPMHGTKSCHYSKVMQHNVCHYN